MMNYAAAENSKPQSPERVDNDEMSLTFNTAFVRTRAPAESRNLAAELAQISSSPACQAILAAAQELAKTQNISELEASEQLIHTFRKLDEVWSAYLHQEGLARLNSDLQ